MTQTASILLFSSLGFTSIALLTLFFSTRRKLFIRTFVPSDDLREFLRGQRQNPDFGRGMRTIAYLQLLISGGLWIAFLVVCLR